MRNAVDCAHAPDERFAVDGNDFAVCEKFLENRRRALVVGVSVNGKKHDVVGDVEIGVGSGQAIFFASADMSGHRKRDDVEG